MCVRWCERGWVVRQIWLTCVLHTFRIVYYVVRGSRFDTFIFHLIFPSFPSIFHCVWLFGTFVSSLNSCVSIEYATMKWWHTKKKYISRTKKWKEWKDRTCNSKALNLWVFGYIFRVKIGLLSKHFVSLFTTAHPIDFICYSWRFAQHTQYMRYVWYFECRMMPFYIPFSCAASFLLLLSSTYVGNAFNVVVVIAVGIDCWHNYGTDMIRFSHSIPRFWLEIHFFLQFPKTIYFARLPRKKETSTWNRRARAFPNSIDVNENYMIFVAQSEINTRIALFLFTCKNISKQAHAILSESKSLCECCELKEEKKNGIE